jgi:hypothetical protein
MAARVKTLPTSNTRRQRRNDTTERVDRAGVASDLAMADVGKPMSAADKARVRARARLEERRAAEAAGSATPEKPAPVVAPQPAAAAAGVPAAASPAVEAAKARAAAREAAKARAFALAERKRTASMKELGRVAEAKSVAPAAPAAPAPAPAPASAPIHFLTPAGALPAAAPAAEAVVVAAEAEAEVAGGARKGRLGSMRETAAATSAERFPATAGKLAAAKAATAETFPTTLAAAAAVKSKAGVGSARSPGASPTPVAGPPSPSVDLDSFNQMVGSVLEQEVPTASPAPQEKSWHEERDQPPWLAASRVAATKPPGRCPPPPPSRAVYTHAFQSTDLDTLPACPSHSFDHRTAERTFGSVTL